MFQETRVAVLEHRGNPDLIGDSVRKFIDWRKQNHLPPHISDTFNIFYDNPSVASPENFQLDICASIDGVQHVVEGLLKEYYPQRELNLW